jgi:hypothetical protein
VRFKRTGTELYSLQQYRFVSNHDTGRARHVKGSGKATGHLWGSTVIMSARSDVDSRDSCLTRTNTVGDKNQERTKGNAGKFKDSVPARRHLPRVPKSQGNGTTSLVYEIVKKRRRCSCTVKYGKTLAVMLTITIDSICARKPNKGYPTLGPASC